MGFKMQVEYEPTIDGASKEEIPCKMCIVIFKKLIKAKLQTLSNGPFINNKSNIKDFLHTFVEVPQKGLNFECITNPRKAT